MKSFLTESQVLILKQAHKLQRDKKLADRIKAVLYLHYGLSYTEIAKLLILDEVTLRRYVAKFQDKGIEGLLEMKYVGGKSKLTLVQEQELKQYFQNHTVKTAKEIVDFLQKEYQVKYSIVGVTKLMHRLGFVYKKPKIIPGKANEEKQKQFLETYQQIKNKLRTNDQIYYIDSTHPQHNTQLSYGWILKGKSNDKYIKSNTGRGRLNLCGALSFNTKKAIVLEEKTVNAQSTINLLNDIKKKQKFGKVYLILDNASYYHANIVGNWFLRHPRFERVFLPPYSPNLNLIERLWKFYHQKITANHYFETFEEFKNTSLDFFKNLKLYEKELNTLLTDNFKLVGVPNFQT